MGHAFKMLAKLKFLRGGAFDVFGRTEERRMERQLDRRTTSAPSKPPWPSSTRTNLAAAIELANLPEQIRGFGHIKLENVDKVKKRWRALDQMLSGDALAETVPVRVA